LSYLFVLILSFLVAHELDAVHQHEWRILPVLETLSDDVGRSVFVGGHVPLFAALIVLGLMGSPVVRRRTQGALAAFMVIHIGLHVRWERPGLCTFDDGLSRLWILGGGILGIVYLAEVARRARTRNFAA